MASDLWLVYDGECPICSKTVLYLRLKKGLNLHLLNAREHHEHPLVKDITARHIDLDQGMVAFFDGRYYHGAEALHLLAIMSHTSHTFSKLACFMFSSKLICRLYYPIFRVLRNLALWSKKKPKINNLDLL